MRKRKQRENKTKTDKDGYSGVKGRKRDGDTEIKGRILQMPLVSQV